VGKSLFEKIKIYTKEQNVSQYKLIEDITISAHFHILKYKIKELKRILDNINNLFILFPEGFSDNIKEIEQYLHRESKDLIDKILNSVICGQVYNKTSKSRIRNLWGLFISCFIDYVLYENTHEDFWDELLGEII